MEQPRTATDEELVAQAQAARDGDWRAMDRLILRHQGRIVANCRYLTRSPGDAEDLAQEVFVKAFFALGRFEGRSRFSTWLQKIKVNHCLNHLKKQEGRSFVDLEDPAVQGDPGLRLQPDAGQEMSAAARRRRIARTLDSLSITLRVPLILRDLDGLSYQEIADLLGLRLSAVKMRIKRAREEFRRLFAADPEPS